MDRFRPNKSRQSQINVLITAKVAQNLCSLWKECIRHQMDRQYLVIFLVDRLQVLKWGLRNWSGNDFFEIYFSNNYLKNYNWHQKDFLTSLPRDCAKTKRQVSFPSAPSNCIKHYKQENCVLLFEDWVRKQTFFCLHSYLPTPVLIIISPNYRLKYTEKALRTRSLYLPFTAKPLRCDHVARAEPILLWSPLYFKTNT